MVFENFTVQDLASINPYDAFRNKLKKLSERIQAEFSKSSEQLESIIGHLKAASPLAEHWGLIIHNKLDCARSNIWIHIGISDSSDERYPPPPHGQIILYHLY